MTKFIHVMEQSVQKISKAPTHKGIVVSDKMDKTIVVKVDTLKAHPKYLKRYISSKRYKIHDENNEHKVGDAVSFRECKPRSKDKKYEVVTQ
jgi:small subunit ribosomal protein S17